MGTIIAGILGFVFGAGFFFIFCLWIVEKFIDRDKVKHKTGKISLPTKRQALAALLVELIVAIIVVVYAIITKH